MSRPPLRVYLVPGLFGFGRLAGYDYFVHIRRALGERFDDAGVRWAMEVVQTAPTASIRRRARVLAETIHESAGREGPIHLLGHSTGGVDARLYAATSRDLGLSADREAHRSRVASVISMNSPHWGTPLAHFFATVSGTRLLYALSLLTVSSLTVGGPGLSALSNTFAALGGLDDALGLDAKLLDRSSKVMMRFVGKKSRREVRQWLEGIRGDQGGVIQLTPEGMDLFNAACTDAPGVRYGSIVTASPVPAARTILRQARGPYAALSGTVYSTVYRITGRPHPHYPYRPVPSDQLRKLRGAFEADPAPEMNDGIVPLRSQLWGELIWAGWADHLDTVGHFRERRTDHRDWLASGANFGAREFAASMDNLAEFILRSS